MHDIPEIDIHTAKEALDTGSATFVDIRDPGSHAAAHIPGCRHIASQQDIDALDKELNREDAVIVYCYHGNASKGATLFLKQKGFTNAHSMTGGFEAWRAVYAIEQ
jgi:thiosulfate sulfurtransferase